MLISAYIKLTPRSNDEGSAIITLLPTANFALVVFLCCGSSSSHLACILVLKQYLREHKATARLRVALVVVFSLLLTVTIALASSINAYFIFIILRMFYWLVSITSKSGEGDTSATGEGVFYALVIGIPVAFMLYLFWICTLQLLTEPKIKIQAWLRKWVLPYLRKYTGANLFWRIVTSRLKEERRRLWSRSTKRLFWYFLLGNEFTVFLLQIIFATLSMVWILLQRFIRLSTSDGQGGYYLCSMHTQADDWNS